MKTLKSFRLILAFVLAILLAVPAVVLAPLFVYLWG